MIDKLNIWHKGEIYCPISEADNMREQRDRFKTRFLIKDRECSEAVKDLWVVQQERNQLAAQVERLREALENITDEASRCDSWECFPSAPIELARLALDELRTTNKSGANNDTR